MSTQDVAALVESVNNLTGTVAGKMGQIDDKVEQAESEFQGFLDDHMDDIHPNSFTPNRLKNSQFEQVGGKLAFWTLSSGLTIEELPHGHFLAWRPENPLSLVTNIYDAPKKVDQNTANTELKYPNALRITNPSADSVAFISQKVAAMIRRDAGADLFSTVFLQVEQGGVAFRRAYSGQAGATSHWLCADGFAPLLKHGNGDLMKKFGVLSTDKMVVADRMVDAHTGVFGIYLQPLTTIVIQAPMSYMKQTAEVENDTSPAKHYQNVTTQISTYVDAEGNVHYL